MSRGRMYTAEEADVGVLHPYLPDMSIKDETRGDKQGAYNFYRCAFYQR